MGLNAFVLVFALAIFAGLTSATIINNCQTLSASDTYELDANITYTIEPCLIINAPNVVLDCKNFAINAPPLGSGYSTAVSITPNGDYAVVQNCQINNFANGIIADEGIIVSTAAFGADGLRISNNVLKHPFDAVNPYGPNSHGIFLNNSLNSQILNNSIDAHFYAGIEIRNTNSTSIVGNTVLHNVRYGIRITGVDPDDLCPACGWFPHSYSTSNIARDNTVLENGYNGVNVIFPSAEIYVSYSNDNVIENNNVTSYHSQTCADNQTNCDFYTIGCEYACGIHMVCASNTQVLSNNVTGTEMGIAFPNIHIYPTCGGVWQNNNVIRGNTIKNVGLGIETFLGNYTVIDSNLVENSAGIGIWHTLDYFGTVSNNVIKNASTIRRNIASAGIIFTQAYFNTISNNQITDSNMHGILFSQDNDDNTLSNNLISRSQFAGIFLGMHGCPIATHGNCVVERNTFTNNNISYNGLAGVYPYGNIHAANVYGYSKFYYDDTYGWIRISGGQDNYFIDNVVQSTGLIPDVYSGDDSSTYFINTPVTRSLLSYGSTNTSNATVSWYLDVHVQDLNGIAVGSAQVTITDAFGTVVFTGATDASGNIPRQTLPGYFAVGYNQNTNYTDYAPYSVAVTNGCAHSTATTPLTSSTALTVALDFTPPTISNVHVIDVTQNTVTLGWETDEPTNETLEYGLNTAYGSLFTNAAFATGHSVFLNGLLSATPYHYRVNACDAQCNCASASDYTFTTITTTGGGGGGGGGGNPTVVPTIAPTTAPTTVPTAGPTTAPTTTPGGVTPMPTIAPTLAATVGASPTIAPGTGLVTAAGPDYGLWGGILLLLILLALLIYWYMRRKKKKD